MNNNNCKTEHKRGQKAKKKPTWPSSCIAPSKDNFSCSSCWTLSKKQNQKHKKKFSPYNPHVEYILQDLKSKKKSNDKSMEKTHLLLK